MAMEKAMIPVSMTRSTGMTRNAKSATRKGFQQHIALRSQVTTMIVLWRALLSALRKSRNILNTSSSEISELEGEEVSNFQVDQALQFAQVEPRIAKLFKHTGSSIKLDINEFFLLDSQSTMDIFFNAALIRNTSK
jgi:hypothetical protein